MGYTHYWTFKPIKRGTTKAVNSNYRQAIEACKRVIDYYQAMHASGTDERLSGYSAHAPLEEYGGINFNGARELAHEDFVLGEKYKDNLGGGTAYVHVHGFCKTARKPYDIVVVACLAVLKHYLGDQIAVSSDGYAKDWAMGVGLARAALSNNAIQNPIKGRQLTVA